jgi:Fe-S cluster assembly protein SufD
MELKEKITTFYGFEEKIDFNQELHDVRSQAIKTL